MTDAIVKVLAGDVFGNVSGGSGNKRHNKLRRRDDDTGVMRCGYDKDAEIEAAAANSAGHSEMPPAFKHDGRRTGKFRNNAVRAGYQAWPTV